MDLRYPIGKFQRPDTVTPELRNEWIDTLAAAPDRFTEAVRGLSDEQLDTPYREGGWTVRQVIHHMADSHMNSFIRFRLALTENQPAIKPYDEKAWAELPDNRLPVDGSLAILRGLHERWVYMLRQIPEADFNRTMIHPVMGPMTLDTALGIYAWHSRHHEAHITALRSRSEARA